MAEHVGVEIDAMPERENRYGKHCIEKLSQEMPWLTATQLGDQAVPLGVE